MVHTPPSPIQTGSFWLCPSCKRHVPTRNEACRCGRARPEAHPATGPAGIAGPASKLSERSASLSIWLLLGVLLAGGLAFAAVVFRDALKTEPIALRATPPPGSEAAPPPTFQVLGNLPRGGPRLVPGVVTVVGSSGLAATGVFVGTEGLVLTAADALGSSDQVAVRTPRGEHLAAASVSRDPRTGLALVRLDVKTSETITRGSAIGLAVDAPVDLYLPAGAGGVGQILSGRVRSNAPTNGVFRLTVDLPLSPDALGAPAVDQAGRLVGMVARVPGEEAPSIVAIDHAEALLATKAVPLPSPGSGDTEEQRERRRAEAIFRPRMEEVAAIVKNLRMLRRRYVDACLGQKTVTVRSGSVAGGSTTVGRAEETGRGQTTFTDPRGDVLGQADENRQEDNRWVSSKAWSDSWREVSELDNASTPACRMTASDIADLAPRVTRIMEEAEQEAVKQGIWTWLQTDVPDKLAGELWR